MLIRRYGSNSYLTWLTKSDLLSLAVCRARPLRVSTRGSLATTDTGLSCSRIWVLGVGTGTSGTCGTGTYGSCTSGTIGSGTSGKGTILIIPSSERKSLKAV